MPGRRSLGGLRQPGFNLPSLGNGVHAGSFDGE